MPLSKAEQLSLFMRPIQVHGSVKHDGTVVKPYTRIQAVAQQPAHANPPVARAPEIDALLAANAPVAVGVSGGKDSQAAAIATYAHLDSIGHTGPRLLIHSDLGVVEWEESMAVCEKLAKHLNTELVVVRRKAGDMMDRWESRWASSMRRYANMETVTMVLPWSTPSMRFCTSELKTHVIGADLRRRFKGQTFVNVTGVRREESASRAKGSVASRESDGKAWDWRPISDWKIGEVFESIKQAGLIPHQAYTEHNMSRVSCKFCIMSNQSDMKAAAEVPESADLYRRMVKLETDSTFGFQGSRWLAEIKPELLSESERAAVVNAKERAAKRVELEKHIPKDLRFEKGWPARMPTDAEAETLAAVRRGVCTLLGIHGNYLTADSIKARYAELMAANKAKLETKTIAGRKVFPIALTKASTTESTPMTMKIFVKAHVNSYTKKDGTVVKDHEDLRSAAHNYAKAAAAIAERVSEKSPHREHCVASSKAALDSTRTARSKRDHMNAAAVHDDAAQHHRSADHFSRDDLGLAGSRQDHRSAAQSHAWAAASHREEASKPPRQ